MADPHDSRQVMGWLWEQIRRGPVKMPADTLVFEGDHDLIYLYNTGFVDTKQYSLQDWLNAFRPHRKPKGEYHLTHDEWMDKTKFRYTGKVGTPFDPMTIREGEWTEEDWKQFVKEKILPETTITYSQFLVGVAIQREKGTFKNSMITITAQLKQQLSTTINKYASPRRQRAMSVARLRQREDMEVPTATQSTGISTSASTPTAPAAPTKFTQSPDEAKKSAGQLSDLLKGSK